MGTTVQAGDIVAGKFRVDRVLGEGGMGVVVAATHLELDAPVALKFLRGESLAKRDVKARFRREARAAARLKGEHIARVFDVGNLDDGAPYIVSELLDGSDLSDLVATGGPLSPGVAADYVLQACAGIAEAHSQGIIHRDLKPANLFLTRRADGSPLIKILDFGIAKTPADWAGAELSKTDTATVLGSPAFMSPEQMRSAKRVDARSDIWALGAILYFLLTRGEPFPADTFPELCIKILQEPPTRPRDGVPDELWDIILTCLRKRRDERYADVAELARALAPHARDEGSRAADRIADQLGAIAPPAREGDLGRSAAGAETVRVAGPSRPRKGRGDRAESPRETAASLAQSATLGDVPVPASAVGSPTGEKRRELPPRSRRLAALGGLATAVAAGAVVIALFASTPEPAAVTRPTDTPPAADAATAAAGEPPLASERAAPIEGSADDDAGGAAADDEAGTRRDGDREAARVAGAGDRSNERSAGESDGDLRSRKRARGQPARDRDAGAGDASPAERGGAPPKDAADDGPPAIDWTTETRQ